MGERRSSRRAVSIIIAASYLNFLSNDPSDIREAATTATATKTSHKNWIRAASNFVALIPSRLIRQMLAICLAVEF